MSSEEILLDEVRNRYNVELGLRNSLDQTAANMILIVGASVGFLMTLSAAILVKIERSHIFFQHGNIVLIVGILLSLVAIVFFLRVRTKRNYKMILGVKSVFESTLPSAKDLVSFSEKHDIENLHKNLIMAYVESTHHNYEVNKKKNRIIDWGEFLFVSSIALIVISVVVQIIALM